MTSFINIIVILALVFMFITTRDYIYIILVSLFCVLFLINRLANSKNPPSWIKGLFKSYGPRSDVKDMTKKHLFSASIKSSGYAVLMLGFSCGFFFISEKFFQNNMILIGIGWGISILFLGFLINALFLLLKAFLTQEVK